MSYVQVTLAHVMNPVRIFHRDEMFEAMVSTSTDTTWKGSYEYLSSRPDVVLLSTERS